MTDGFQPSLPPEQGFKVNRRFTAATFAAATTQLAVPANSRRKVYHLQIKIVTSATVGARLILVQLRDAANNVYHEIVNSGTYGTGRSVTAGLTERYELTIFSDGAAKGITLTTLMNNPYLMDDGESILITDTAAIDGAGDTAAVEFLCEEWINPGS